LPLIACQRPLHLHNQIFTCLDFGFKIVFVLASFTNVGSCSTGATADWLCKTDAPLVTFQATKVTIKQDDLETIPRDVLEKSSVTWTFESALFSSLSRLLSHLHVFNAKLSHLAANVVYSPYWCDLYKCTNFLSLFVFFLCVCVRECFFSACVSVLLVVRQSKGVWCGWWPTFTCFGFTSHSLVVNVSVPVP
jgi:hypothetical protein